MNAFEIIMDCVTKHEMGCEIYSRLEKAGYITSNWISVKDRLPEHWVWVWAYFGKNIIQYQSRYDADNNKWWCEYDKVPLAPSHWMPLPEPPEAEHE